jgi:hypothetical protein
MAITHQDKLDLKKFHATHCERFGGCIEDYFALQYLVRKFACDIGAIANQVAFGGNDFGLDAFYIDRPSRNLYLYQFKWSEDHALFNGSMDRLADAGMRLIFGNGAVVQNKNEFLNHLKAELSERPKIDRVFIHFVFMGDREKAENSKGLEFRKEELEKQAHLVQDFFNNPELMVQVEFLTEKRVPSKPVAPDTGEVRLEQHVLTSSSDGIRMFVGFIHLMDLYGIEKHLGQRFLSRNIRFGLSEDNAPNRKIREALNAIVMKGTEPPDLFAFNHNGVAIAAQKIEINGGGVARLICPRLLNGAQTLSSLKVFLEKNPEALTKHSDTLHSIRVLAKIVEDNPNSPFITNVTICNNQQNPVLAWNLRANDLIQCDLEDKLVTQGHVLYERQENAMENYSEEELEAMGVDTSRAIRIKHLAQTFLAMQGEIVRMSKLPDVFEIQKQYVDTFRQSYLGANVRRIVLAYKVYLLLSPALARIEEQLPEKWMPAFGKARNLCWALLLQGIFNDPHFQDLLQQHGGDLRKTWEFKDYLRKVASARVLPILKAILSHKDYAPAIKLGKFEFLRTKNVFDRGMDLAGKMFGWTKRSI